MAYTSNPNLPRVRMQAARLVVNKGWSTRKVARHFGYDHSTVVRWSNELKRNYHWAVIPTKSSRPRYHPHALSTTVVQAIITTRLKYHRGARFIHFMLQKEGYAVSLSSVKRTLQRQGLISRSKWKKWRTYAPRPAPEKPGVLVEIDTVHDGPPGDRLYVYTLLDVCSRWAWAAPVLRITTHRSLQFVEKTQTGAPFVITTLQSDHGPEFGTWFTARIAERGMAHRYSRVRTPTDNAHLERFNRTVQDECLSRVSRSLVAYERALPEYLHYYNTERPHYSLDMRTPMEVVQSY